MQLSRNFLNCNTVHLIYLQKLIFSKFWNVTKLEFLNEHVCLEKCMVKDVFLHTKQTKCNNYLFSEILVKDGFKPIHNPDDADT